MQTCNACGHRIYVDPSLCPYCANGVTKPEPRAPRVAVVAANVEPESKIGKFIRWSVGLSFAFVGVVFLVIAAALGGNGGALAAVPAIIFLACAAAILRNKSKTVLIIASVFAGGLIWLILILISALAHSR